MRILVACEFSGIVRDAFAARGHDAYSCDLLESERPGNHFQCDVRECFAQHWDMMIAFPPCTYLTRAATWRWSTTQDEQRRALEFVRVLLNAPIERIALENPIGRINTAIRNPDQIIHPWQFGEKATKATCLWLKNLPALTPTKHVAYGRRSVNDHGQTAHRWRDRARTFQGIADAMADQWG